MEKCNETNSKEYKVYLVPKKKLKDFKKAKKVKVLTLIIVKYGKIRKYAKV
jgi:hypothetical protein